MICESGATLGVRRYASGDGSEHILMFHDFHEIRICYVFHGHSVTRMFCNTNSIAFIMSDRNNHTATAVLFALIYKTHVELRK